MVHWKKKKPSGFRRRKERETHMYVGYHYSAGDEALAALVCALAESGVGVVGLTAQTKSLEDIFLSLTQTSGEVA